MKTYKIKPINSISDIPKGTFSWVYSWIDDKTVPLKQLTEEKEITLLELHETIESNQLEGWIQKQGEPIEPNYLLGLAIQHPEALESGKDYVASSSVFTDEFGNRCFLYVGRDDGKRLLSLVNLYGDWGAVSDWVFLSSSVSSSLNSSPLSPLSLAIEEVKSAGYEVFKKM